jgi:hypothetical protein
MVANAYNPSYYGGRAKRISVGSQPRQKLVKLYLINKPSCGGANPWFQARPRKVKPKTPPKKTKGKRTAGVVQAVQHLPHKCEALRSIQSTGYIAYFRSPDFRATKEIYFTFNLHQSEQPLCLWAPHVPSLLVRLLLALNLPSFPSEKHMPKSLSFVIEFLGILQMSPYRCTGTQR